MKKNLFKYNVFILVDPIEFKSVYFQGRSGQDRQRQIQKNCSKLHVYKFPERQASVVNSVTNVLSCV